MKFHLILLLSILVLATFCEGGKVKRKEKEKSGKASASEETNTSLEDSEEDDGISDLSQSISDAFEKLWKRLRKSMQSSGLRRQTGFGSGRGRDRDPFDFNFPKFPKTFPTFPRLNFSSVFGGFGDMFGAVGRGGGSGSDEDDFGGFDSAEFGVDAPEDGTDTDTDTDEDGNKKQIRRSATTMSMSSFTSNGKMVKVVNKCKGSKCKLCIEKCKTKRNCSPKKCFEGKYGAVTTQSNCPVAVCGKDCAGFIQFTDKCPICRCKDYSTREPCKKDKDCPSEVCKKGLCQYPGVSSAEVRKQEEEEEDEDPFAPPPTTKPKTRNERRGGRNMVRKEFN